MPLHNADVAAVFDEIADLLDIESANPLSHPGLPARGPELSAWLARSRRARLAGA